MTSQRFRPVRACACHRHVYWAQFRQDQDVDEVETHMTEMTYARYLALDALLDCQRPQTGEDDELLFIIIHQTKELWLKQMIRELRLAKEQIQADALVPAYKALARVSRIQAVMTMSWDILATMTPVDYSRFRHALGPSSGFQSDQFRTIEYLLGLKDRTFLKYQADRPHALYAMEAALGEPSIWDDTLAAAARAGLPVPDAVLNRDLAKAYAADPGVEAVFVTVYQNADRCWELYQLAEKLVDLDDAMATWRHKHVLTVERIIGGKRGTGGTEGAGYLRGTLGRRAFPELWTMRTAL